MEARMKIAFSGPSGLGKTTLAHLISERVKAPHPSTSAGDIFTEADKQMLKIVYGYEGKGHQNVINLSSIDPGFGYEFQELILKRRAAQIAAHDRLVLDRCPIDNLVYLLTQVGHNLQESEIKTFINRAQAAYTELTHVIMIRHSPDIPFIEDNESRVPNRYFQQYISDVFGGVYTRYFSHIIGPRVMMLDFWNLQERIATTLDFINTPREVDTKDYGQN